MQDWFTILQHRHIGLGHRSHVAAIALEHDTAADEDATVRLTSVVDFAGCLVLPTSENA